MSLAVGAWSVLRKPLPLGTVSLLTSPLRVGAALRIFQAWLHCYVRRVKLHTLAAAPQALIALAAFIALGLTIRSSGLPMSVCAKIAASAAAAA